MPFPLPRVFCYSYTLYILFELFLYDYSVIIMGILTFIFAFPDIPALSFCQCCLRQHSGSCLFCSLLTQKPYRLSAIFLKIGKVFMFIEVFSYSNSQSSSSTLLNSFYYIPVHYQTNFTCILPTSTKSYCHFIVVSNKLISLMLCQKPYYI